MTLLRDISDRAVVDVVQRRSFPISEFEFREDGPTGFTFEGVASVVDHPYPVRDQFGTYTETIKAGAFNKTLKDGAARVSLYVNHRHSDVPLATRTAGTLTLSADPHLRVKASLDPERPDVQVIASAIRRGEMGEMSIGFMAVKARDKWNDDWTEVTRNEVALREASIVEAGANTGGTLASLRAFDEFMTSIYDVEMTEDEIKRAIAHFTSLLPSDGPTEASDATVEAAAAVIAEYVERDIAWRDRAARYRLSALAG
ncbi:MAG TPA: HK97 family phage prohead protease [Ilumatobacteraceae bacterium]|nr:HK97 family phage prohead protease [Ilumatobacteraceae bacterium]